jgi:hypothetical protein
VWRAPASRMTLFSTPGSHRVTSPFQSSNGGDIEIILSKKSQSVVEGPHHFWNFYHRWGQIELRDVR